LFEASGATVTMTRTSADTGTAASLTVRQGRAAQASATVGVGLEVVSNPTAGLVITYPNSTAGGPAAASSLLLSSKIASGFSDVGLASRQVAGVADPVLAAANSYSRVTLGSTSSLQDLANFQDPSWAEKIAHAIYQGVGSIYGSRSTSTP
jgi:N-acetylmuramoyl-L-alanine amidase